MNNPDITHRIKMDSHTVRCYGHTDETVTELVKRYYEGKYKKTCEITDRAGNVVYSTIEGQP